MKLKVPYFPQEKATTCGVAALRMVMGYFGEEISEKEILREVKLHSFGVFTTDLGRFALKRGYKVTCSTFHLSLLAKANLKYGTKIDQKILKSLKVSPKDEMIFESWKKYLENGGELIWDFPKIEQLKKFSNKKLPGLITVNTATLGVFHKVWNNGHYLVVRGFGGKEVEVLNPSPKDENEQKIDPAVLLASWTVNSMNSSDYLMVVER